jgi:hypothetical protein
MKKNKLPGDIAKIIRKVGNKRVEVKIMGSTNNLLTNRTITRDEFDSLMKCVVITFPDGPKTEGDEIPSGFYSLDFKKKEAKLFMDVYVDDNKFVQIDKHVFQVFRAERGWTYA